VRMAGFSPAMGSATHHQPDSYGVTTPVTIQVSRGLGHHGFTPRKHTLFSEIIVAEEDVIQCPSARGECIIQGPLSPSS
jgi:hypothetical protein